MALRKRTDAYWARRSAERLTLAEEESEPYIKQTLKVYEDARRDIVNELKRMYAAYYKKDKGFDKIALNSMAPQGSLRQFRAEMARLKLPTYLPDNYAGRISRLELFESQIRARVAQVGLEQNRIEDKAHRQTIENAYYRSIYDVSRGIGATPAFHQIDQRTIDKILSTKFEGKNYSKRIWSNTNVLAEQLREKLAKSIATGASLEKTVREFTERFNVGETYAKRLIRTETNYFENTAEIESYAAMGIEEFVFVATLDNRTSDICQSMDGKKFKVSEAVAGENYPPLHPNCRSTIRAYIGKEYEPETRIYRDPKTGRNKYTYNMSYDEWYDNYIKGTGLSIKDGFSKFNIRLSDDYDKLLPVKPPKNIFQKIPPNTEGNIYSEKLTVGEIDFYNRLNEIGYKFELIPVSHSPTKDVKIAGINWELKTIVETGENTIRNAIFKATDQNKQYIILDTTFMDKPTMWIINKVREHLAIPKNDNLIKGIVVVRGKKLIRVK